MRRSVELGVVCCVMALNDALPSLPPPVLRVQSQSVSLLSSHTSASTKLLLANVNMVVFIIHT